MLCSIESTSTMTGGLPLRDNNSSNRRDVLMSSKAAGVKKHVLHKCGKFLSLHAC